jgi:hypothetical protein
MVNILSGAEVPCIAAHASFADHLQEFAVVKYSIHVQFKLSPVDDQIIWSPDAWREPNIRRFLR